jgi:hypothetical protein
MAGAVNPIIVGQVTVVSRQEGDRVLVSFPMVGFPPGFLLRPGDRVVLVHDENGFAVRPLVRAMTVQEPPSEPSEQLMAGEQTFALQAATVREDEGDGRPYSVWVVDNAEGAQGQVIAFRPQRR